LTELDEEDTQLRIDLTDLAEFYKTDGYSDTGTPLVTHLEAESEHIVVAQKRLRSELADLNRQLTEQATEVAVWGTKLKQAAEYERVVERGIELREQFDALPPAPDVTQANAELSTATTVKDVAAERLSLLQRNAFEFDGQCPVTCKACPAPAWVHQQATSSESLDEAQTAASRTLESYREAKAAAGTALRVVQQHTNIERELDQLRARAEALADVAEEVEEGEAPVEVDLDHRQTELQTEWEHVVQQRASLD